MKKVVFCLMFLILFNVSTYAEKRERCYHVKILTTQGTIIVKLSNSTPLHRDNFVKLAKSKYYDNVLFHRVINKFVIQAGDPDSKSHEPNKLYGNGGPNYTIPKETPPELFHKKGVIAAARESDTQNPKRESSASQFYIVTGKIYNDQELDKAQAKIIQRDADCPSIDINGQEVKYPSYTIPLKHREIYKTLGGVPHLDSQYSIFGEVISGMDVVEKIEGVSTDSNDRPIDDVWIISTKVFRKR